MKILKRILIVLVLCAGVAAYSVIDSNNQAEKSFRLADKTLNGYSTINIIDVVDEPDAPSFLKYNSKINKINLGIFRTAEFEFTQMLYSTNPEKPFSYSHYYNILLESNLNGWHVVKIKSSDQPDNNSIEFEFLDPTWENTPDYFRKAFGK